ncbi:hypothetical protein TNCV_978381 [Trichonephila clavipes]|nr:hypothetical protein TNCV_978381 [Trichonephila clavipes]
MRIESFETQSPPVGMVWKRRGDATRVSSELHHQSPSCRFRRRCKLKSIRGQMPLKTCHVVELKQIDMKIRTCGTS